MSHQASLRIAGKAKYKRMIELGKTMLLVYANPEPMLSMMIIREINCNGVMLISTLNNKKFRD